jgi:hypothetical protein
MSSFIDNLLNKYGVYELYELNSQKELIMRKNIINLNDTPLNKVLTSSNLTKYQKAYFVYTVISGLEIYCTTLNISWYSYKRNIDDNLYSNYFALKDGQNKLLIVALLNDGSLTNILNTYQLCYLNYVLSENNWDINNCDRLFNLEWQPDHVGMRNSDISEIFYDFFENPVTRYTVNNMKDYIILAFRKLYSYNRFLQDNKSYNLNQLVQLLNVIISSMNINHKFREFLNILDEEQILMLGM